MEITVYTKQNCPACTATKKAMDRAGLDYEAIDVSDNLTRQRRSVSAGSGQCPSLRSSTAKTTSPGKASART